MPEQARGLGPINAAEPLGSEPLSNLLRRRLAERYRVANARLAVLLYSDFDRWKRKESGR